MSPKHRVTRILSFIAANASLFLVSVLLAGCAGTSKVEQLANTGPAKIHRVQSERLKLVMRRLNSSIYAREATALDIDAEHLRRAREMADVLAEMSQKIIDLAGSGGVISLDESGKERFHSYARELAEHGKAFHEIAVTGRAEAFTSVMRRTVRTCNSCHDSFRDM